MTQVPQSRTVPSVPLRGPSSLSSLRGGVTSDAGCRDLQTRTGKASGIADTLRFLVIWSAA